MDDYFVIFTLMALLCFSLLFMYTLDVVYIMDHTPTTWICLNFGVIILLLMMATAFLGYVLVWGQMSFWAATVITNFFTAFPIVGDKIVTLLWWF